MPEAPPSEDGWPTPSGRDEVLLRVVAGGRRKLLINRIAVAAAVTVVGATVVVGLALGGGSRTGEESARSSDALPSALPREPTPPVDDPVPPAASPPSTVAPGATSAPEPVPSEPTEVSRPHPEPVPPPPSRPVDPVPSRPPSTTPSTTAPVRPPPPPDTPSTTTEPTPPPSPPPAIGPILYSTTVLVGQAQGTGPECSGPRTSTVVAVLAEATSATLSWDVGPDPRSTSMDVQGRHAFATLGPFGREAVGPITVTVTAEGPGGRAERQTTMTLVDCPTGDGGLR